MLCGESVHPQITRNSCVATNPQTEKHPVTFNPEQKLFHNLIQEDERKTETIFNRKIWLLAFSRKILGKKKSRYESDFEHMGPKVSISNGWDFSVMVDRSLHRNLWIHHGYFYSIGVGKLPSQKLSAFAVLGYLRLDDSLCVTSSCFPPMGSLPLERIDRAWGRGEMDLKSVSICASNWWENQFVHLHASSHQARPISLSFLPWLWHFFVHVSFTYSCLSLPG